MQFTIRNINTVAALNAENIEMRDKENRRLYASGIIFFEAKINGNTLSSRGDLKIKIPAVGETYKEGYNLYRGEQNGEGKIIWVNTGRTCDPINMDAECKTYDFDFSLNGYCACAKPRECEEDCNENPFGGEEAPNLTDADVRYSGNGVVGRFADGTFEKPISDLEVKMVDDPNFKEDLDMCGHFMNGVTTKDVFPAYRSVKNQVQNIIVSAKDGSNAIYPDDSRTLRVYVPRELAKDLETPILVPGARQINKGGYIKWINEKMEETPCLGSVNCKYIVYDVPAYGNYKLAEWQDAGSDDREEKYILKIRVFKDNKVYVGERADVYSNVYIAGRAKRMDKERSKEHDLKDYDPNETIVLVQQTKSNGKMFYNEAKLSELDQKSIKVDKTGTKKDMYIMRRKDFKNVGDWSEMELSKCK